MADQSKSIQTAQLVNELQSLRDALIRLEDNLIFEDDNGDRWAVSRTLLIGSGTDDPGLVVRLTVP
jgi:hypothetical protein